MAFKVNQNEAKRHDYSKPNTDHGPVQHAFFVKRFLLLMFCLRMSSGGSRTPHPITRLSPNLTEAPIQSEAIDQQEAGQSDEWNVDAVTEPSAVAPDAGINFKQSMNPRESLSSELHSSIRRYRARFCKTRPAPAKSTDHLPTNSEWRFHFERSVVSSPFSPVPS